MVSIHDLAKSLGMDAKQLRARLRRDDEAEGWRRGVDGNRVALLAERGAKDSSALWE